MTPRTLSALAVVVAALALAATPAAACQPEYCPDPPLLCEWGPFAGTCVYPY